MSVPQAKSSPSGAGRKSRVYLVEDYAITRYGMVQLINQQADLVVCGEADTVRKAIQDIVALRPEVAVIDLTLKQGSGFELIKTLAAQAPEVKVLVMSMHDESLNAEMALHAGAAGYIMKEEAIEKMLVAIRQVLSGRIFLSEDMTLRMVSKQISGQKQVKSSPVEVLSRREMEVLQLIGQWRRTQEIAETLHLSPKTIEYHRQRIKEKLCLKDAKELTQFATEWLNRERSQSR